MLNQGQDPIQARLRLHSGFTCCLILSNISTDYFGSKMESSFSARTLTAILFPNRLYELSSGVSKELPGWPTLKSNWPPQCPPKYIDHFDQDMHRQQNSSISVAKESSVSVCASDAVWSCSGARLWSRRTYACNLLNLLFEVICLTIRKHDWLVFTTH